MTREKEKEGAERQQKIDNDVRERIDQTKTYEELEAIDQGLQGQPKISPELKAELNKELHQKTNRGG